MDKFSKMLEICHLSGEVDTAFPNSLSSEILYAFVITRNRMIAKLHTVTMCHCKTNTCEK